jgi:hypothetical protein
LVIKILKEIEKITSKPTRFYRDKREKQKVNETKKKQGSKEASGVEEEDQTRQEIFFKFSFS